MDGITISTYEDQEHTTAKFDLTVTVNETDEGFSVSINYCTDLFKEETIQRMALHYQKLLTAVMAAPSSKLSGLSMLSDRERLQLLEGFNDTDVDFPKDTTIVDLFQQRADSAPEAIAVVSGGEQLTYRELDQRTNQLARYLGEQGAGPNALVGICIERGIEMIVGILGILKAGAAYLPMDPQYPKARIAHMVADSGTKILLTSSTCAKQLPKQEHTEKLILDTQWKDKVQKRSTKRMERAAGPESTAYVIYTSGSTGTPKGAINSHRAIFNRIMWTQGNYRLGKRDVVLQKTSFGFDVSVWELIWPLTAGARLLFARQGAQADVPYLKELIDKGKVTTMHFVPSMLTAFLEGSQKGDHRSLKRVLCSGEALSMENVRNFRERFPDLRLDNLYGPTEAAIDVTSWTVPKEVRGLGTVPIGRPVDNTRLYVLDRNMALLPIGAVGELYIGGEQVSDGYLNREDLTKEKFVQNPFRKGDRLYRTGDLARWAHDGNIEFIGRRDHQVKLRGFRIELGEIENAISVVEGVRQACVTLQEGTNGDKRLVAYAVTEGEIDRERIQRELAERLPEYMVPRIWVPMDRMPLTANGKLDRRALPLPEGSELSAQRYTAPRTPNEERLARIWRELLGIEKVGVHDNFFALGGHSLLAVRLMARIRETGHETTIRDIFTYPSIALLADRLSPLDDGYRVPDNAIPEGCAYITPDMLNLVELDQDEIDAIMDQVPGGPTNIQDIYPLSPLQQGMYFHHLVSGPEKGDPYVLPSLISFSSTEKRERFMEGLRFVIRRHDVLRTCVLGQGLSQNVQVVLREVQLPVERVHIDGKGDILAQVKRAVEPENLYIDLERAPMLRTKIADDTGKGTYYLVLNYHHLMMDHVGLEKVVQEILVYLSKEQGKLPPPAMYRDFIGHALEKLRSGQSREYFSKALQNVGQVSYPFGMDDTRGDGSTRILTSKKNLPETLGEDIRRISAKLGTSPATLFHAAFGIVVARWRGNPHAQIGAQQQGRRPGARGERFSCLCAWPSPGNSAARKWPM